MLHQPGWQDGWPDMQHKGEQHSCLNLAQLDPGWNITNPTCRGEDGALRDGECDSAEQGEGGCGASKPGRLVSLKKGWRAWPES